MGFEEQTSDVITFPQFEEGNLISETRNDTESGDEYNSESIMMSRKDMENLDKTEKVQWQPYKYGNVTWHSWRKSDPYENW